MISTSFITGTGFMKCIPITFSGRLVTEAILVMEMDDVFDARMAPGFDKPSISENSLSLVAMFSVAASTTRSAVLTPSANDDVILIFFNAWSRTAAVIVPFSTWRPRFFSIVANAFFSASSEISMSETGCPNCAKTCAIPLPIVPYLIIAIVFVSDDMNV